MKAKGFPTVVTSWRDLGREGHGRAFAEGSPYVRNGIFIQGHKTTATRESGPGLPLARRRRLENPGLKTRHKFVDVAGLCLTCNLYEEGHDRMMVRIKD